MDKINLASLQEKYKLPKEEHEIILKQLIQNVFFGKPKKEKSSIHFVIGQPGSGKSTFINSVDLSEFVIINSDNYRGLIKNHDEILENYPTYYSKITNYDAHLWGDELFAYGVSNGYSVLREKVPVDNTLLEIIRDLSNNYEVTIDVLIAGDLTSLLATRERYEEEIKTNKAAKLSNIDAHNKCYDNLPSFISSCVSMGIKVNYVIPNNGKFEVINPGEDYLTILKELREKSNKDCIVSFEERIQKIKESMLKRNASQEEFDELDKIEKKYNEEKKKKNLV